MVRAKFLCTGVRKYCHWDKSKGFLYEASFSPVTGGSQDNDNFFAATPSGEIKMSTIAENHFEPGKFYFVDFTLTTAS